MTAGELIETVVGRYYEVDLPEDPDERLAALRDLIVDSWNGVSPSDRLALAAELDEADDITGFAGMVPKLSEHEQHELDEQAVDGLVERFRLDIPELAPGDANPMP
jgi:hypothetical protein